MTNPAAGEEDVSALLENAYVLSIAEAVYDGVDTGVVVDFTCSVSVLLRIVSAGYRCDCFFRHIRRNGDLL